MPADVSTYTGSPGVFVNEVDASQIQPSSGVARTTKRYCLMGIAQRGEPGIPYLIASQKEFVDTFGDPIDEAGFAAYRILAHTSPVMYTRITNGTEEARTVDIPGWSIDGVTEGEEEGKPGTTYCESALNIEVTTPGTYFNDEIKAYIKSSKVTTSDKVYKYELRITNGGTNYAANEILVAKVTGPDQSEIPVQIKVDEVQTDQNKEIIKASLITPLKGPGEINQVDITPESGSTAGTGATFSISSTLESSVNYSSFFLTLLRNAEYASELLSGWFTTNPAGGTRKDSETRNKTVELTYIGGVTLGDFIFSLGVDEDGKVAGILENSPDDGYTFTTGSNGSELINDNFSKTIELLADSDQFDYDIVLAPPYAGTYGLPKETREEDEEDESKSGPNITTMLVEMANNRKDIVPLVDPPRGVAPKDAVEYLTGLGIDSSYVAMYYPHCYMKNSSGELELFSPSVAMAIGMASEYENYDLWVAPAGRPRMVLDHVIRTEFRITKVDRDLLYENMINPICNYKNLGMTALGQKNLYSRNSAINRLGVRFLLNYVKKAVEQISARYLFNAITTQTFELWTNEVASVLGPIKRRGGLYDYVVTMDETTVTSEMVNNNVMPGLIQVKPTRSAEYIPVDIVVRNRDDEFSVS